MEVEQLNKIVSYLKDDIQIRLVNKEYVPSVDDEIEETEHDKKKWFHNAWKLVIENIDDKYMWDSWGNTDLNYLLERTLVLFEKAKNSKKGFEYLKKFLK